MTPIQPDPQRDIRSASADKPSVRRAGLLQVARTVFFGLLMVGKKTTWEKDGIGARMTPGQIVVGAILGGLVVVTALVAIVHVVLGLATGE